jgi:hypothetical protein
MAIHQAKENTQVVLWDGENSIGDLSADRVTEIQGVYTGPLVAVVIDGGVAIIQPMNPNTGLDWESEDDALSFGFRYLGLNVDGTPIAEDASEE